METSTVIDATATNNSAKRSVAVLLLAGLIVLLGASLGLAFWQQTRQKQEIQALQQRWQDQSNAVVLAKLEEHVRVQGSFMTTNQIQCKVVYDQAKAKNYIEIRAANSLQYHHASFTVCLEAQTETWAKAGRKADPKAVSLQVVFNDVPAGESAVMYLAFPATVATHATTFWGKIWDFFRWTLPTVEAPIDARTVAISIHGDHAQWVAGNAPSQQTVGKLVIK